MRISNWQLKPSLYTPEPTIKANQTEPCAPILPTHCYWSQFAANLHSPVDTKCTACMASWKDPDICVREWQARCASYFLSEIILWHSN